MTLLAILSSALGGCVHTEAPYFEFFGAFFPAWMLCALAGIGGAVGTRVLLVSPRLSGAIPYQLAVCTAAGIVVGVLVWLVFFR